MGAQALKAQLGVNSLPIRMRLLMRLYRIAMLSVVLSQDCTVPDSRPLSLPGPCLPGFYCPNASNSDTAALCPPTSECLLLRLAGKYCEPQGRLEPALCLRGFFCATPLTQVKCPSGYYVNITNSSVALAPQAQ